ncbi:MAG: protein kinase [Bacteroidales bacterium]|nr:protein kinase [Bacteroidales bacterium]
MAEESSEFENDKLESSTADEIVLYTSKNTVVKKFRTFGKWQISKEIAPEFAFDAKHRQSLNQEFEIGFQLDHPNIVRYIDKKVSDDGVPRLILEYVDGSTLRELLDSDTCVSQKEFDSIFGAILSALSYLHRRQIYHLDVKPENIVVTHKEHVAKLIDFGFAITASNEKTLGTSKKYAAPEFSESTDEISGQTDMYAFAKTMQEFAGRKSISLSKRQKRIIKSALQQDVSQRITADKALALLQKPQRKGWIIMILLVVLVVVGLMFVLLRKEQKVESPQVTHDTVVVERQQDKIIIDSVSGNVVPAEPIPYSPPKNTRNSTKKSAKKQTLSIASDTNKIEKEIHYNEEDSLFVTQEYARCKDCVEALKQEYEIKMDELKEKQLQGSQSVLFEMKWMLGKYKNELLECSNNMNRTIQKHLQHYIDEDDKDTYNYYCYEFIKKLMINIPF